MKGLESVDKNIGGLGIVWVLQTLKFCFEDFDFVLIFVELISSMWVLLRVILDSDTYILHTRKCDAKKLEWPANKSHQT